MILALILVIAMFLVQFIARSIHWKWIWFGSIVVTVIMMLIALFALKANVINVVAMAILIPIGSLAYCYDINRLVSVTDAEKSHYFTID
jgi:hypothetical protein